MGIVFIYLTKFSLRDHIDGFHLPSSYVNISIFYNCDTRSALNNEETIWAFKGCEKTQETYYTDKQEIVNNLTPPSACSWIQYPVLESSLKAMKHGNGSWNLLELLKEGIALQWEQFPSECSNCTSSGGRCALNATDRTTIACYCKDGEACDSVLSATFGTFLLAAFFYSAYTYKKKKRSNSLLLTRAISSEPSSKGEYKSSLQQSMIHVSSITVFTYEELEEATINFSPSKELGDGGFGTVYLGKLRDGRLVAIKRLYENNCKQVEQFMNEIKILSSARHPNLVCLYGCTSRHSRELLLVYEYMPNGTVADHLHGDGSKSKGVLSWKIRMSIAIETADALAYLHSIEPPIIHRDVKTNNILLDNNFRVKVADFGMSRLFPLDVTHVSTAPLGTPGYVDPDYHQCYQLTDKSDVYSFGVVLAELISGKPAVDIARHRHEINLATMAINKIQNRALHELVDPEIGFESDPLVKKMVTLVAELTFRCLSLEKDLRPTMEEVAAALRLIESNDEEMKKMGPEVFGGEEVNLLKSYPPCSPDSVTDKWVSRNTTPNSSS
ncbi:hypothetical protein AMTR_s00079p00188790 [Amborella trichopoda]|uniref:Protein kinase domain-containing protein n=1 Tax=Amborella trichopoda TaxID=13333 RepID=W1PAJ8_AMBTC|nr:hypothetical protein AMTR_s00079p00188790 [Amborella trichopoda]